MDTRTPMAQLLAISLILASVVNLAFIWYVTTRPRTVLPPAIEEAEAGGTAAGPAPVRATRAKRAPRPQVPIEAALRYGDINEVKRHISWCTKHKTCDLEKDLRVAVEAGNEKATEVLVSAGANVNTTGARRETPLHTAAGRGGTGVARVLLGSGAEVDARDARGGTPLHEAVSWGHVGLTRLLLESGADVHAMDSRRQTALHLAAARRIPPLAVYADVTRMLLESGARPNARASDGATPLALAKRSATRMKLDGNMKAAADANEVVTLLRNWGAAE